MKRILFLSVAFVMLTFTQPTIEDFASAAKIARAIDGVNQDNELLQQQEKVYSEFEKLAKLMVQKLSQNENLTPRELQIIKDNIRNVGQILQFFQENIETKNNPSREKQEEFNHLVEQIQKDIMPLLLSLPMMKTDVEKGKEKMQKIINVLKEIEQQFNV